MLTHNRDEHHTRSIALLPRSYIHGAQTLLYPKDEQGGGTWFAADKNYTVCLLNGAFKKHVQAPCYRHSRGLVVTEFFSYNNVAHFIRSYDFTNIESFTFIIVQHDPLQIHEIVNDEGTIYVTEKNPNQAHLWSSVTLYSEVDRLKRATWFEAWLLLHESYSQDDIIEFHQHKFDENQDEGILINRNNQLRTVSLTSVLKLSDQILHMKYKDFIQSKKVDIDF